MFTFGMFARLVTSALIILELSITSPIYAEPTQGPLNIEDSNVGGGNPVSAGHTVRKVSDQPVGVGFSTLLAAKLYVTVFVTSQRYSGNLVKEANKLDPAPEPPFNENQGLEAGDFICNSHASGAGLWGNFAAWLSKDGVDAKDRLTPNSGPFIDVNGLTIADNIEDLTDGDLDAPIVLDELGQAIVSRFHRAEDRAWTGTGTEGTTYEDGHCNGWSQYAEPDRPLTAAAGKICEDCLADWTFSDSLDCNWKVLSHLYCFQVMPALGTNPPS